MAAPSCPSDSHTTTAHNTVFIDTNLDTHLALMVSSSDTVFDLKKKIMSEHPRCFPNTGEIKIHALKVKRKEYFYHLSDYMFVRSAFEGVKNNWFLSADASSLVKHSENFHSCNHDSTNVIACIGLKNNSSADGVDFLLPAGRPKRSSNFNDSSLPQIGGSPNLNQEVPVADRFGSGGSDTKVSKDLMMEVNLISKDHFQSSPPDANKRSDLDKEVSKDLEMEVIHESDDHFKSSSSDANKRSDPERQEKSYPYINDYEVPGIRTEGNEDNSMNRISDVQCNVALEGAVNSVPAAKKKGKAKRKVEDAVDDLTLEESNALVRGSGKNTSQQGVMVLENSLGDAGGPASCDMEMGNENIAYEPYRSLLSDTGKRSDHGVEKLNDPGKHIECGNNNFENGVVVTSNLLDANGILEHDPEKKRKKSRKTKSLVGATQVTAGTEHTSGSGSVIDTKDQPPVVVKGPSHLEEKDTNIAEVMVTSNLLDTNGTLEPDSEKKIKKSRKTKGSVGAKQLTAGTENASASGSVIDRKDQPPVVVNEQSHLDEKDANIAEVVVASNLLYANGTLEPDSEKKRKKSRKTKSSVGASQVMAGTEGASARGSVIDMEDQPPVVVKEPSHLDEKDTNIAEVVVTSNLLDANGILEHDSEKKRKKSRKTKSSVGVSQVTAGTERASASGSVIDTKDQPPVVVKEPSHLDKKDTNIAEVVVTSNLFDANGIMEHDSEKKRKKSRKTKSSVGATQVTAGTERASGSVIDMKDQPSVVVKEPSHLDKKDTNIAEVVVTSNLLDANGIMVPDSEKKKKKYRKTKSSVAAIKVTSVTEVASGSGIFTEPQKAVNDYHSGDKAEKEGSVLSQREGKEVSKIVTVSTDRKTDEVGKNEVESLQISKTEENTENADEKEREKTKKIRKAAAKSLPNVQTREQDAGGKDPEQSTDSTRKVDASSKVTKKKTKSEEKGSMDQLNGSNMEPGKDTEGESNQINFNDYFMPPQHQHEVNASQTRAMLEKSNSTSSDPSSSLDNSKRVIHQEKRSNENQSQVVNRPVPVRKISDVNKEVVNGSENKKSLLATSGMIFKDAVSETSDDKDEVYSSDASTRSPLDNSSSSDYSDVESNANFNSQQNGFYISNRNESGGKGITEPHSSSGLKNLTLDTILRSSSRYKKAKLTASQLETESQPIDFVPDSQADH